MHQLKMMWMKPTSALSQQIMKNFHFICPSQILPAWMHQFPTYTLELIHPTISLHLLPYIRRAFISSSCILICLHIYVIGLLSLLALLFLCNIKHFEHALTWLGETKNNASFVMTGSVVAFDFFFLQINYLALFFSLMLFTLSTSNRYAFYASICDNIMLI